MTWFIYDKKDKELIEKLKASKPDFKFDEKNSKARLMMALGAPIPTNEVPAHPHFLPKYAFGLTISVFLVIGTASISYASDKARPGERLFSVQKFQNNIVLSLPLTDERKAQIRTDIVAQRLEELETIQTATATSTQVKAEIIESEQSINNAATNIAQIQAQANNNNAKMLSIIKELDELSNKHQLKMELLKEHVSDEQVRTEIDRSLQSIQANRERLHQGQDEGNKNSHQESN